MINKDDFKACLKKFPLKQYKVGARWASLRKALHRWRATAETARSLFLTK